MGMKPGSGNFCLYWGQSCTQLLPGGLLLALLCCGEKSKISAQWQSAQIHRRLDLLHFLDKLLGVLTRGGVCLWLLLRSNRTSVEGIRS